MSRPVATMKQLEQRLSIELEEIRALRRGFQDISKRIDARMHTDMENNEMNYVPIKFVNPSGGKRRIQDAHGQGHYGASRKRTGKDNTIFKEPHMGVDIISIPGQRIVSPIKGTAVNLKRSDKYPLVAIVPADKNLFKRIGTIKLIYVNKPSSIQLEVPYDVEAGDYVGNASDLVGELKYGKGMTNHIHIQFDIHIKGRGKADHPDPTPYFFSE